MNRLDKSVREEALDPGKSFIVQAPAGSGKTTLLTGRFISLLEHVAEPEEILAVTFTNKATREMKHRILKALDPNSEYEFPQQSLNSTVERVRRRSQNLNWNLLHQPERLQIMTIDALCAKLVRHMPWSSRFGSMPSIAQYAGDLLSRAARNTVQLTDCSDKEVRNAVKLMLQHVDNNSQILSNLIEDMLQKRDQWLRIISIQSSEHANQTRVALEQGWNRIVEAHLHNLVNLFPPEYEEELVYLADFAAVRVPNENSPINACVGLQRLPGNTKNDLAIWTGIVEILLTQSDTWRTRYDKRVGFFPSFKEEKSRVLKLKKNLEVIPDLLEKLAAVRTLPKSEYTDDEWKALQAITKILPYAVAQLMLEFRRRGQVDFVETAQQANFALGTPEKPSDLALIFDYRFNHILIDEFQDISVSQRELLKNLTAGWQSGDGRTLFAVGDPMQSIYRFREAEVGIFLSALNGNFGQIPLKKLVLEQNFRSNGLLVDWYNAVFKDMFHHENDASLGAVAYSPSSSSKTTDSNEVVQFKLFGVPRELSVSAGVKHRDVANQVEARELVKDIKNHLAEHTTETLAILVRSRGHMAQILPVLQTAEIIYHAVDLEPLQNRLVVRDILSLTRALLNMSDRVSWLAILRAPWCGINLKDLTVLATAGNKKSIWEAMCDDAVVGKLSDPGKIIISRTRKTLKQLLAVRGRYELRQWIEDAWTMLGGPACVSHADRENASMVLDLLDQYARGTDVENIWGFESNLNELYAAPEFSTTDARVHVMTIHGAKGLEFDAVFIPGLARFTRSGTKSMLCWAESNFYSDQFQLLVAPLADDSSSDQKMFNFLNNWNNEKNAREVSRLLYVACTRAKHKLYLYGCVALDEKQFELKHGDNFRFWEMKAPAKTSLLKRFEHVLGDPDEFAQMNLTQIRSEALMTPEDEKPDKPAEDSLCRLPVTWTLPSPPSSLIVPDAELEAPRNYEEIDFDWAGNEARWIGLVVHEWLHRISMQGIEYWNLERLRKERQKWRIKLAMLGVSVDRMSDALNRVEVALGNTFADDTGRWLLSHKRQEANSEWKLTGVVRGYLKNVIIDRTFVDGDVRWIVDYKTGYTESKVDQFLDQEVTRYAEQLDTYGLIISQLDSRPIELGLYFPMHKGWRKWSFNSRKQSKKSS